MWIESTQHQGRNSDHIYILGEKRFLGIKALVMVGSQLSYKLQQLE